MAEALYRKYRPQVFEDVVGQETIERTLKNAIAQDKVSHAYLFCGPRGTGKTTTARLLAKALLCQGGPTPDPDGTCEDCQLVAEGAHPDVYELDAASRTGVENVRDEIISRVHFAPTRGRYKVYIIDEVHMLSTAAFNALLKTLEEPPSHVVFILCTTDPQKVPETIHSRCQRFDFHRISPESMVARLGAVCVAEGVEFEGEALDLIAQRADGGLRNALTSLEQIIAFENGKVTLAGAERLLGSIDSSDLVEIMAYIGKRDIANCFRWTAQYVETGADLAQFVRDMAEHVRDLYIMALVGDDAVLEVSETTRQQLASELAWFGADRASRLLGVLGDLMAELKTTSNPRLAFEVALTRMVRPDSDLTLESLAERIEALESGYSAVAHVLPGEPVAPRGGAVGIDVPDIAGSPAAPPAHNAAGGAGALPEEAPPREPAAEPRRTQELDRTPTAQNDAAQQASSRADVFSPGETVTRPDGGGTNSPLHAPDTPEASDTPSAPDAPDASGISDTPDASDTPGASDTPDVPDGGLPAAQGAVPAQNESQIQPRPQGLSQDQPQPQGQPASRLQSLANPAALQRIWQAALADVKKRKQAHGVLFMNTKVRFDAASGSIVVQFPEESTFAYNAVQKPDVQDALDEALKKAVGEPVAFWIQRGQNAEPPVSAPMPDTAGQPLDTTSADSPSPMESATQKPVSQPPAREMADGAIESPDSRRGGLQAVHRPEQTGGLEAVPAGCSPSHQAPDATRQDASDKAPDTGFPGDQVPYEEVPYEEVPYDEAPYGDAPYSAPYGEVPYEEFDAGTTATPTEPHLDQNGALEEDAAALQAMLQASFGAGVVLSETDE